MWQYDSGQAGMTTFYERTVSIASGLVCNPSANAGIHGEGVTVMMSADSSQFGNFMQLRQSVQIL